MKNNLKNINICDFTHKNNSSGCYRIYFSTHSDLFHSYQCYEPISNVDKWGKSYEISLQTFYRFFEKLCVAMPHFQRHIYSIRLRTGRFFNTDRLIIFMQCNEPILKVDKWGKSYEISLQTFYRFFEEFCVAMQTFQRQIYSIIRLLETRLMEFIFKSKSIL